MVVDDTVRLSHGKTTPFDIGGWNTNIKLVCTSFPNVVIVGAMTTSPPLH